jgi:hypothetical protein
VSYVGARAGVWRWWVGGVACARLRAPQLTQQPLPRTHTTPSPLPADNKGIGSEASYPYTAADGTCKKVPSVSTITSFTDVPTGSETALMTAAAQQPVSVAVEADQDSFQFYTGGVMTVRGSARRGSAVVVT